MFYPLAFCLIHSGTLVDFLFQIIYKQTNTNLLYWALSGSFLSGFFNLIAFICDPYFQSAIKSTFNRALENSDSLGESQNFPGEIPRYEVEARSLSSKDSRASNLHNTKSIRRKYYTTDQRELDNLLREISKDL